MHKKQNTFFLYHLYRVSCKFFAFACIPLPIIHKVCIQHCIYDEYMENSCVHRTYPIHMITDYLQKKGCVSSFILNESQVKSVQKQLSVHFCTLHCSLNIYTQCIVQVYMNLM